MERILAISDVYNLIGAYTCPDDRFRVFLTSLNLFLYQTYLTDRQHVLSLWTAWLRKTPSPEPEPIVDYADVDYDRPPTSPSASPVLMPYNDYSYRHYDFYQDRDPDSPFSDIEAELNRQDDCWSC